MKTATKNNNKQTTTTSNKHQRFQELSPLKSRTIQNENPFKPSIGTRWNLLKLLSNLKKTRCSF